MIKNQVFWVHAAKVHLSQGSRNKILFECDWKSNLFALIDSLYCSDFDENCLASTGKYALDTLRVPEFRNLLGEASVLIFFGLERLKLTYENYFFQTVKISEWVPAVEKVYKLSIIMVEDRNDVLGDEPQRLYIHIGVHCCWELRHWYDDEFLDFPNKKRHYCSDHYENRQTSTWWVKKFFHVQLDVFGAGCDPVFQKQWFWSQLM